MRDDQRKSPRDAPRVWPGMPTRRSQMVESILPFLPIIIGITVALLLPLMALVRQLLIP